MAKFIKGDVVVVPFPFSDLTRSKRRPAYVLADLTGDDIILCQITSQNIRDSYDKNIILYRVGRVKKEKVEEVKKAVLPFNRGIFLF